MWPRHAEFMLACWLALSPFVFRHDPAAHALWWNDFTCAAAAAVLAVLPHWHRARRVHLLLIPVGLWLMAYGRLHATPEGLAPAYQNHIMVGLLLVMFAIIPSRSAEPPRAWREFYDPGGAPR